MKGKKYEFSKMFIVILSIMTAITIYVSIYSVFTLNDTTILQYLIPAVFAELASGTAMYYWMIKSINKIKIITGFIRDLKPEEIEGKQDIIIALVQNL